ERSEAHDDRLREVARLREGDVERPAEHRGGQHHRAVELGRGGDVSGNTAAPSHSGKISTRTDWRMPPTRPRVIAPRYRYRTRPSSAPQAHQATREAPKASPAYVSPT